MSDPSPAIPQPATPSHLGLSRTVLSFPVMLAALLVVLAVLTVSGRFDDPDMWWHLKMGQVIATSHTIPRTDLFSFTAHNYPYTAHEWLSQWIIFTAFRVGGYSGLMLWLCFFASALLIAGYALCALYSGNAKVAFLGAMTIWFFATIGLSIRPQMIGYLLVVVELLLIHLGRARNARWFYALPPLFALWVNLHGSFVLGIAVAAIFSFSSFCDFQLGGLVAIRWDTQHRRALLIALALSFAALFVNPIGVKLVLYPFKAILVPSIGVGAVAEWQPLQISDPRGLAMLAVLGGVLLLVIVRRSQLFWHELLLLALATWLAAGHRRLLFAFGILVAPVLSRLLAEAWGEDEPAQDRRIPNAILIATSLLVSLWAFPNRHNLSAQVAQQSPVKAVEFIESHHLSGPMLNEWVFGGYLMWAAPDHPVFIDGRGDIFEWTGVLAEFGKWALFQSDPNALLDKYRINFCLLARGSPMAMILPMVGPWTVAYTDTNAVILTRSGPASAPQTQAGGAPGAPALHP